MAAPANGLAGAFGPPGAPGGTDPGVIESGLLSPGEELLAARSAATPGSEFGAEEEAPVGSGGSGPMGVGEDDLAA